MLSWINYAVLRTVRGIIGCLRTLYSVQAAALSGPLRLQVAPLHLLPRGQISIRTGLTEGGRFDPERNKLGGKRPFDC